MGSCRPTTSFISTGSLCCVGCHALRGKLDQLEQALSEVEGRLRTVLCQESHVQKTGTAGASGEEATPTIAELQARYNTLFGEAAHEQHSTDEPDKATAD